MASNKIKDYLNSRNVKYSSISHSPEYTAQEIAAAAHVSGQELAKAVIVKLDGKMVMCVLPASHYINFPLLKKAFDAREASLVPEEEYKGMFPDCDPGAQPPFGHLYGMDVLVSRALSQDREIAFNACSYTELIRLSFEDYLRLVNPTVMDFSVQQTERRRAA